jgi:long-chain acyl-CoA synthetase
MPEQTVYTLLRKVSEVNKKVIAYRYKKEGRWQTVIWRDMLETCKKISKSYIALGLDKGDKINILSDTNLEWIQLDFAAVSIGCVTVGIYASNAAHDCAFIINHSDAKLLFLENHDQVEKIAKIRNQIPGVEKFILLGNDSRGLDWLMTWNMFLEQGKSITNDAFRSGTDAVEPEDIASIVYTSGTTGVPKGVMISHQNLLFASESVQKSLYLEDHFETLLFLPLAHVFARIIVYLCLRSNITIAIAESINKMIENLKEIRPHFFCSVPRIFEKVYDKILNGMTDRGGLKASLFQWALTIGKKVSHKKQQKQAIPSILNIKYALANKFVFRKIKSTFGGNIVFAISGAAPLNKNITEFFHACGLLILEGLGMTENVSFTNVNRYDNYRFGTVGQPGPGIEQKIAEDGEILFRSKNIMPGYYKNSKATAETIDKEGWLHTGDIGEIDEDGFLRIKDRKKDIIITAGGKNIAPQYIERFLQTSHYVNQVVVIGDSKKYLTALITLKKGEVEKWAAEHSIVFDDMNELVNHSTLNSMIRKEVDTTNSRLSLFETVKYFTILPGEFTIESNELTPTLKIRRKIIMEKYKEQIEAMYQN